MRKLISMALVGVMLSMTIATIPATAFSTDYTYENYTGTFDGELSLNPGSRAQRVTISTDWGLVRLNDGNMNDYAWMQGDSRLGDFQYNGYNINLDYRVYWIGRYFNDSTYVTSILLYNHLSEIYTMLNNSNFAVLQRFAEFHSQYTGSTPEWNLTLRLTICKTEPYMRFDVWLRNLNTSSAFETLAIGVYHPVNVNGRADYKHTIITGYEAAYRMRMVQNNSGLWAIGHLGPTCYYESSTWCGTPTTIWGNDSYGQVRRNTASSLHAEAMLILGDDTDEVLSNWARLGGAWRNYAEPDACSFVVAKNSQRFDTWRWFNDTTYEYSPSETTEQVYVNGVLSTHTFESNPIVNFRRIPIIGTLDHHVDDYSANKQVFWNIVNLSRTYDFHLSIGLQQEEQPPSGNMTNYVLGYFYNLTQEQSGTLFGADSHLYNHTSLMTEWNASYARTELRLSDNAWQNISTNLSGVEDRFNTVTLPGNHWGGETTWDGLRSAGAEAVRTVWASTDSLTPRYYYNLTTFPWHEANMAHAGDNVTKTYILARGSGYYMIQSHPLDFADEYGIWGAGSESVIADFWSNITWENNTEFYSLTFPQFYDIWDRAIAIISYDNYRAIDMTAASANHRLYLDSSLFSNIRDVTTGNLVQTTNVGDGVFYFIAEAGHIYSTGYSATVSSLMYMSIQFIGIGIFVAIAMSFVMPIADDIKHKRALSFEKMSKIIIQTVVFIVIGVAMYAMMYEMFIG